MQARRDGLQVHDSPQQAIALGFKAADPSRYFSYRRAAWRQLRTEVRTAPVSELWRYIADMPYWLENRWCARPSSQRTAPSTLWNRRDPRTPILFLKSPDSGMARSIELPRTLVETRAAKLLGSEGRQT